MTQKLNVLVLESEQGAGDTVRGDLERAGHTVVRCHEPGAAAFPCNALANGTQCPLDDIVDVAVDVRPLRRAQPAPLEDGVRCALQRHVPLVVVGSAVLNPFAEYASAVVDPVADVVATCERAAAAPLRKPSAAAAVALREVLDRRGFSATPMVAVLRKHGRLVVEVRGAGDLDEKTKQMASVRIVAAVRAIDSDARGVDVAFVTSP
jgi:hypothetical protein